MQSFLFLENLLTLDGLMPKQGPMRAKTGPFSKKFFYSRLQLTPVLERGSGVRVWNFSDYALGDLLVNASSYRPLTWSPHAVGLSYISRRDHRVPNSCQQFSPGRRLRNVCRAAPEGSVPASRSPNSPTGAISEEDTAGISCHHRLARIGEHCGLGRRCYRPRELPFSFSFSLYFSPYTSWG